MTTTDPGSSSKAPRWMQSINALLHEPPASDFAHTGYWWIVLGFLAPLLTLLYVPLQLVRQILCWTVFYRDDSYYDCNQRGGRLHDIEEMAIVITGCDSGFGKELALYAAHELGYVVFAGCLDHTTSWKMEDEGSVNGSGFKIIPFTMDVTKDADVQAAVQRVRNWLNESPKETMKQRVFHALVNNAGVGRFGLIDWASKDLADFHFCMDGTWKCVVFSLRGFLLLFLLALFCPHIRSQLFWHGALL
jgi:short chain dehydrogenase